MQNKAGLISGFVLGVTGFLLLFKIIFLDKIPPEDEVPPGVVVATSVLNGILFSYAGSFIQNHFKNRQTRPKP